MLLTRRKTFTAAVAILGASTAGVLAFAQRPNESAKPAPLTVQAGTSIGDRDSRNTLEDGRDRGCGAALVLPEFFHVD